jgi:hypothetical protein
LPVLFLAFLRYPHMHGFWRAAHMPATLYARALRIIFCWSRTYSFTPLHVFRSANSTPRPTDATHLLSGRHATSAIAPRHVVLWDTASGMRSRRSASRRVGARYFIFHRADVTRIEAALYGFAAIELWSLCSRMPFVAAVHNC